jgi:hypothetical protein
MKSALCFFVIFLVLVSFVYAQEADPGILPNSALYGLDKIVDNMKLAFSKGEDKAKLAMQIRQERLAEVQFLVKQGIKIELDDVESAILDAQKKADVVKEEVSPEMKEDVERDVEESVQRIVNIKESLSEVHLENLDKIEEILDKQLSKEEQIKIAAELARRIGDYCDELSKIDYDLVLAEPKCNPDNAPEWLKKKVEGEMKERQEKALKLMVKIMTQCFEDPRKCDCSSIPVKKERSRCEKSKALAIKCEFKEDMKACEQLDSVDKEMLSSVPIFARPFIKETLSKLKAKKEKEMFERFAPVECVKAGVTTRKECERIMVEKFLPKECKEREAFTEKECQKIMFEIHGPPPEECMKDGRFIGDEECREIIGDRDSEDRGGRRDFERKIPFDEKRMERGPPQECMRNGIFIGDEECREIMGAEMRDRFERELVSFEEDFEEEIEELPSFYGLDEMIEEDERMIFTEKGISRISDEEINNIIEEAERGAEVELEISEEAKEIYDDIKELEVRKMKFEFREEPTSLEEKKFEEERTGEEKIKEVKETEESIEEVEEGKDDAGEG